MTPSAVHSNAVQSVGHDSASQFEALRSGCGIFNLKSRAKIALTGSDRVRWLNGMVTNNIRDLAIGAGVYAFLLSPQGHIQADLYAYNRGESILLDTDRSQLEKILAIFDRYIIMDDVEVADISDQLRALAVIGPKAKETLKNARFDLPPLTTLQFAEALWQGKPVTIMRGDHPGVDWYEIWVAPGLFSSLIDALTGAGAVSVGPEAVNLLRIAAGIPRYGEDIRERDLPQETSQERSLNFNKGCYLGQEIVERIRSRGAVHRKFAGFEVEGDLPAPGTRVQSDGKDFGEITSVAALPLQDGARNLAIGYIRREFVAGKKVQAGSTHLTVSNLPFAGIFSEEES